METEIMPIGVMTWVSSDPFKAVLLAQAVGVKTMQLGCPTDEYYRGKKKEEFMKFLKESAIRVTMVFCGYAGESYASMDAIKETVGFRNPRFRDERMKKTFQISDFAKDLGVDAIAAHIGFVPKDTRDPTYKGMVEAVQQVADYCKKNRQYFALETGQESAESLLRFIGDVGSDNVKVNFDPANMLYYGSGAPLEALRTLKNYVIGVHCKDFKMPKKKDEKIVEVPFGEGDVGAEMIIRELKKIGYKGALTIERESQNPEQQKRDMIKTKAVLEKMKEQILIS